MKLKSTQILLLSTFVILLTACQSSKRAPIINTGIGSSITQTIDAYLEANLSNDEAALTPRELVSKGVPITALILSLIHI